MAARGRALSSAHQRAAANRAAALLALSQGRTTVREILAQAAAGTPGLRSLRVVTLLTAQPGWTPKKARIAHRRLRMLCQVQARQWGSDAEVPATLTVAHLLDGRTDRSVPLALVLARPTTPVAGFPFVAVGGCDVDGG